MEPPHVGGLPTGDVAVPQPRMLDQVRHKIRLKHSSIRTKRVNVDRVRGYVHFHGPRHPKTLGAGAVETVLTHPAGEGNVAAATEKQANSAPSSSRWRCSASRCRSEIGTSGRLWALEADIRKHLISQIGVLHLTRSLQQIRRHRHGERRPDLNANAHRLRIGPMPQSAICHRFLESKRRPRSSSSVCTPTSFRIQFRAPDNLPPDYVLRD